MKVLYGTLDLLILRTLVYGPSHGHAIAKHVQRVSEDALRIETGSLYPALHKLADLLPDSRSAALETPGKRSSPERGAEPIPGRRWRRNESTARQSHANRGAAALDGPGRT